MKNFVISRMATHKRHRSKFKRNWLLPLPLLNSWRKTSLLTSLKIYQIRKLKLWLQPDLHWIFSHLFVQRFHSVYLFGVLGMRCQTIWVNTETPTMLTTPQTNAIMPYGRFDNSNEYIEWPATTYMHVIAFMRLLSPLWPNVVDVP